MPGPGRLEPGPGAEETGCVALYRGCDLGRGVASCDAVECLGKRPPADVRCHCVAVGWKHPHLVTGSSQVWASAGLGDAVFDGLRRGPALAQGPREPGRGLSARLSVHRGPQPGRGPSRPLFAQARVHPVLASPKSGGGWSFFTLPRNALPDRPLMIRNTFLCKRRLPKGEGAEISQSLSRGAVIV